MSIQPEIQQLIDDGLLEISPSLNDNVSSYWMKGLPCRIRNGNHFSSEDIYLRVNNDFDPGLSKDSDRYIFLYEIVSEQECGPENTIEQYDDIDDVVSWIKEAYENYKLGG